MEWRDIPDLPFYQASEDGRIRSVDRRKHTSNGQSRFYLGKEIAPASANQYGHPKCRVGGKNRYVHQLVAMAFLGPRPEGTQVCHIDGNAKNCAATNLRYGTPTENNADKRRHGTHRTGERHPGAILTAKQVAAIRIRLARGDRQAEIAHDYEVSRPTISAISVGRSWK